MTDGLIERIYEASIPPAAAWSETMAAIAAHCGAQLAWLLELDTRTMRTPLWSMWGASDAVQEQIRRRFIDPAGNELMALGLRTPVGRLVTTQAAKRRIALERTRVYQEAMVPLELEQMMVVNLERTPAALRSLSVFRPAREGAFRPAEQARFVRLARHVGRATRLRLQLERAEHGDWLSRAVLDRLQLGVLVLDERLRVVLANRRALRLAEEDDGLRLADHQLRLASRAAHARLRSLLAPGAAAASAGRSPAWVELELPRRSGRRPYVCLAGRLPHRPSPLGRPLAAHVLFVSDPEDLPDPPEAALGRLWGLTPAEAEVCLAVTHGRGLRDAADELEISVNTVRTHVARVLHKTGTARQAELIRLVVSSLGAVAFEPGDGAPPPEPSNRPSVIRSDDEPRRAGR
ncbi:MAG: helix-turn-helix transcriptional regulator [Deltaproteobacteria bacterium]|nr:helix-turn-helix transcriptional regulator [Deltaproteobacteria bacterium]